MAMCTIDCTTACEGTLAIYLITSSLLSFSELHSCDKIFQAPSHFLYCKQQKAGKGLEMRLNMWYTLTIRTLLAMPLHGQIIMHLQHNIST